MRVDVALLGGGGAGLTLLDALADSGLRIAVVDPVRHTGNDRTWCFWDSGDSPVDDVVRHSWRRIRVVGPDGDDHVVPLGSFRYAMVRSADFYARVHERVADAAVSWIDGGGTVHDGPDVATVLADGTEVAADWVFDSRPARPAGRATTALWQCFRGTTVETATDTFDPAVATLMDFSVPQPASGLAFGYVLPVDARHALVEYTVFARERRRIDAELEHCLPPGRTLSTEEGAIPMTDAAFARRTGRRVFRIGTAGGATRPSTGYTFRTMLRQADAIAARLVAGAEPVPPRPYPRRHRIADAVLLRAIDRGLVDGPRLLTDLLTQQPIGRVLRFLDGTSRPAEELALLAGTPIGPMLRATTGWLAALARPGTSPVGGVAPGRHDGSDP